MHVSKTALMVFYAVLIVVMAVIGYFVGKDKKEMYAAVGALIGLAVSVLLWFVWGKKATAGY